MRHRVLEFIVTAQLSYDNLKEKAIGRQSNPAGAGLRAEVGGRLHTSATEITRRKILGATHVAPLIGHGPIVMGSHPQKSGLGGTSSIILRAPVPSAFITKIAHAVPF
jgi:hypothetical protein